MVPLLSKSRFLLITGCCCSSRDWLEKGVLLHAKINAKMNWHVIMFLSVACKGAIDVAGGLWYCKTVNWLGFSNYLLQKIDSGLKHLLKIKQEKAVLFYFTWHRTALIYIADALKGVGKSSSTYLLLMLVCCTKRSHWAWILPHTHTHCEAKRGDKCIHSPWSHLPKTLKEVEMQVPCTHRCRDAGFCGARGFLS